MTCSATLGTLTCTREEHAAEGRGGHVYVAAWLADGRHDDVTAEED